MKFKALLAACIASGLAGCFTPLESAGRSGDVAKIEQLIASGADINKCGAMWTPLCSAAYGANLDAVKTLIKHGASLAPQGPCNNAVHCAVLGGNIEVVKYLVKSGAPITDGAIVDSEHGGRAAISSYLHTMLSRQDAAEAPAASGSAASAAPIPPEKHSDADAPAYHDDPHPADVALVVGVEHYNGLPAADYAERDAKAVRDHLLALGYAPRRVILLTGPEASRAGLTKNIEKRLPEIVTPESTVFFYYSGHGAPNPATGKAFLLPVDGDPQYLEETAYSTERLYEKLGALKAKRVIVALDSCFSGAGGRSVLAKGTRPLVSVVDHGNIPATVVSLSASTSAQISGTIDEQGHGAFTYYLLKGLSQGKRTTQALYVFIKPQVEDAARLQNRDQSPTITGADAPVQ